MRILFIALGCVVAGCAGTSVTNLREGQSGWLQYPSSREPVTLRGELLLPKAQAERFPAMIVAHGSGGLDERSRHWAAFLQEHGIAALVIDYFGPRGVQRDSMVQPIPMYDAVDAFRLLGTHPRIDPKRIGIMGFSRGGVIALATANLSPEQTGGHAFAAHVALYPVCASLVPGQKGSGAPLLVLVGGRDELVSIPECEHLVRSASADGRTITLKVYDDAAHAWDGDWDGVWFHRALNLSYTLRRDRVVTEQSRKDVLEFLRQALRP